MTITNYKPEIPYAIKQLHIETYDNKNDLIAFYENQKNENPKKTQEFPVSYDQFKGYKESFKAMKISCNPSLKTSITSLFDSLVENYVKNLDNIPIDLSKRADYSILVTITKKTKDFFIKNIETQHCHNENSLRQWNKFGLKQWLDQEINAMPVSKNDFSLKEMNNVIKKFWESCSSKWMQKNNLEKYIPNKELSDRMSEYTKKHGGTSPNCGIFVACYQNVDKELLNIFENTSLSSNRYRLVKEPLANDIIIYLDPNELPVHAGVVLDPKRVISKSDDLCILKHDIEDGWSDSSSYILLRERK